MRGLLILAGSHSFAVVQEVQKLPHLVSLDTELSLATRCHHRQQQHGTATRAAVVSTYPACTGEGSWARWVLCLVPP